jgi:ribonuclease P protein component
MAAFAFPRAARLLQPAEFEFVFAQAQRHSAAGLTVLARPNGLRFARLGLAIAKKNIPAATQRNRIRRLARDYFRLHRADLPHCDLILMTRSGCDKLDNPAFNVALARCFSQISKNSALSGPQHA